MLEVLSQYHGDVRQAHRGTRVTGVGGLNHIRREEADRIGHFLTHVIAHLFFL
jgi:hypothetical protein